MSSTAFTNIATLVTNDPNIGEGSLGILHDATVVIEDSQIKFVGKGSQSGVDHQIDCSGKTLLPGFVDSHTHLIFAGDRSQEFSARSRGEKYTAGGITTTVAATRQASNVELQNNAQRLLNEALSFGTTTVEIKSGYGLNELDEARSIEIASQFTSETTLLAAHVVPSEFKDDIDGYVELIITKIIPATQAKWIDVFCDTGAFTEDQSRRILKAGIAKGLIPRIHANQLQRTDAVQLALELGAASADHLSNSTDADIQALAASQTVATLLPGAEFSTQHEGKLGRKFLDAGASVAIASDCNPGSSYTTSMPFCIAAAVSLMGFNVEEAVLSATLGGAKALRRTDIGKIAPGFQADMALLNTDSYIHLAYRPGVNLISHTYKSGSAVTTWQK
ncbi:HutI Imidazolonepropionase and related amidohydrolases [Candidatus Nanopelagicaceae bacterium]